MVNSSWICGLMFVAVFHGPFVCSAISEYLDEAMLIPKNTSVLIRRVPGRPRMPIVAQPDEYCSKLLLFDIESYPLYIDCVGIDCVLP